MGKWMVYKPGYFEKYQEATEISLLEVTEHRVRGRCIWDNGQGVSNFDVKRQKNNRFFRGSGSGKIQYSFKILEE